MKMLFFYSPFYEALEKLSKNEYNDIMNLCTKELDQEGSPNLPETVLLRGTFYQMRGEIDKALADFDRLLDTTNVDKSVSCYKYYFNIVCSSLDQYQRKFILYFLEIVK